jgi:hypothetical protein
MFNNRQQCFFSITECADRRKRDNITYQQSILAMFVCANFRMWTCHVNVKYLNLEKHFCFSGLINAKKWRLFIYNYIICNEMSLLIRIHWLFYYFYLHVVNWTWLIYELDFKLIDMLFKQIIFFLTNVLCFDNNCMHFNNTRIFWLVFLLR